MANPYNNEEQKAKWNKYNNAYAKKTYKIVCLKLNRETDKDIIDFFENSNESPTKLVRKLVRCNTSTKS